MHDDLYLVIHSIGAPYGYAYPVESVGFGDCEPCASAGFATGASWRQNGTAIRVTLDGWRSSAKRLTECCGECLRAYYPDETSELVEGRDAAIAAIRELLYTNSR